MDCTAGMETPEILLQGPMQSAFMASVSDSSSSTASSSSSSLVNLNQHAAGSSNNGNSELPSSLSGSAPNSKISSLAVISSEKKDCPLILITRNDVFGRYIVAKEDIPAGTVIVSEPPAAFGPDGDGCEGYEIPLCLGCCMIMNDENEDIRCSKCNWPVCSTECENVSSHAENECKYFVERKIQFPPDVPIATCYKGIQVLRGLLLQWRDSVAWNELMQLQDWTDEDCKPRDFVGLDKFRRDVLGLPDAPYATPWNKILGIYNVNSFSFMMKCETEERSPSFGEFLFLTTSLFSHSCAPNANWAIGCSPHFLMRVRATVDIRKGDMISVPYTYDHMNYGTYGRVIRQQSFKCKCVRCLDPTELQTFNSAIKCFTCQVGLVLPLNPVDLKSEWECRRCLVKFKGDFVILFVEALADEVENCDNIDDLEAFIATHRDKTLHPNHWVLNLASNSILSHRAHCLQALSKEELERFLWHCFYILEILNVLAPGSSLFRGNVLLLISKALLTKTELSIRKNVLTDKLLVVEEMKQVYSYQKAALLFWEDDHSYRPENETHGPEAKDLIREMTRVHNEFLKEI